MEAFKHKEGLDVHLKAEGIYTMKIHADSETWQESHRQEQQN